MYLVKCCFLTVRVSVQPSRTKKNFGDAELDLANHVTYNEKLES